MAGFSGTLAALFFAVFVFGGIVPFLLVALVVGVAGVSVLRRGVPLALRRHARDRPRVLNCRLPSSVWKPAGEREYAQDE